MKNSVLKTPRRSIGFISRLIPLMIFASLFILTSCEREDMYSFAQHKLAIGDTGPGGGIVFYVTDGGLHGLEAARVNLGSAQPWSNMPSTAIGNTGTAIGTGQANTYAIISQAGHVASAAKSCREYKGGNKNDWFLPSKDELNLMYLNLMVNGLCAFNLDVYWSSSENAFDTSHNQNFNGGTPGIPMKSDTCQVRAIRSF